MKVESRRLFHVLPTGIGKAFGYFTAFILSIGALFGCVEHGG